MAMWFEERYQDRVRFALKVKRQRFHGRSEYQSIDVFETDALGAALALDGVFQTSIEDEYIYHEMLVHPALTTASSIKNVVVVGGGDGGSVREVLRYPEVEHVTLCELDQKVVEVCREHLPELAVPWDDPRLEVRFGDGVAFLEAAGPGSFDVILVDGPDPVGPAEGLFESPFYQRCKACLAPGGVLALQSESPFLMAQDFVRIVRTVRGVFPRAQPYYAPVPVYVGGAWSFTHASTEADPLEPKPERLAVAEADARYYSSDIHRAAFVQPPVLRKRLA